MTIWTFFCWQEQQLSPFTHTGHIDTKARQKPAQHFFCFVFFSCISFEKKSLNTSAICHSTSILWKTMSLIFCFHGKENVHLVTRKMGSMPTAGEPEVAPASSWWHFKYHTCSRDFSCREREREKETPAPDTTLALIKKLFTERWVNFIF